MELIKKTPSTPQMPANQASEALGGDAAMGVGFAKVTIEQRQTGGGNANTSQGVSGGQD